ncbi:MAG: hypothetical protein BWX84_01865 [Verrucomicrobia bacterium ADurb.Bin118]|nr:MAG: hypothetical protein BWX84_01865 [Verrucomicrobia bacterium ADurb.Bin118]
MFLTMPAVAAYNGFLTTNFIGDREPQPMIPENREVQVIDESAIGRVRKNVIHALRFKVLVQRGGIVGQHPKIFTAVQPEGIVGLSPMIVAETEHFFLGG